VFTVAFKDHVQGRRRRLGSARPMILRHARQAKLVTHAADGNVAAVAKSLRDDAVGHRVEQSKLFVLPDARTMRSLEAVGERPGSSSQRFDIPLGRQRHVEAERCLREIVSDPAIQARDSCKSRTQEEG